MAEPDESSKDDSGWEDVPELRDRLRDLWNKGEMHGFYSLVLGEMEPRLRRYLLARYDLDHDEIDDAIGRGIEGFEVMQQSSPRPKIKDPYNYLFTAVRNAANDIGRERNKGYEIQQVVSDTLGLGPGGRVRHPQPDGYLGDTDPSDDPGATNRRADPSFTPTPSGKWATAVIEETLLGVEANVDWAVPVVELAISRLPPQQRRVVQHLATEDFDFAAGDIDYKSTRAAEDLDMSPAAFRQNKKRAYDALSQLIPEAIEFLGVVPNVHVAETIFGERPRTFPSEDDDDGGVA